MSANRQSGRIVPISHSSHASACEIPGLMLLVPGSLGFRSFAALLAEDTLSGVQAAFTMTLVAVALVSGLLIAHVLVPPRRVL